MVLPVQPASTQGITRIERLMTDKRLGHRYRLREVCAAHDIVQKSIRPHRSWD